MFGWQLKLKQWTKTNSSNIFQNVTIRCVSQSYYDILKVPQSCSSKDVRDAFITLSKQNHPDKHGNDPSMHERFVQINEAYSVLINPTSRRAYDMTLSAKRKLNAPHEVYTRSTYTYHRPQAQSTSKKKQTGSSSYSSTSGSSNDYFYSSWDKRTVDEKGHNESYYGIKGVKKMSNSSLLLVILGFTCVGATLQWLAIRAYSKRAHEQMLENSHKLSLIHAMAREKARLYGNDYQLNILKSTLKTTYDDVVVDEPEIVDGGDVPETPEHNDPHGSCDKCKKCKNL